MMDRSPLLPTALLLGAIVGSVSGCRDDAAGYRTVTEAETAERDEPAAERTGVDVVVAPSDASSPAAAESVAEPLRQDPSSETVAIAPTRSELEVPDSVAPEIQGTTDGETGDLIAAAGATDYDPLRSSINGLVSPAAAGIESLDGGADRLPGEPQETAPQLPGADAPIEPREIKLLIPEKKFNQEGPAGALRVSYDDLDLLKVLNMEPVPEDAVNHFPKWLMDLDGERIRVRGFMYPTFQESGLTGFVLARDNQICCFGRNPKIYDLIEVSMRDGVTTSYIQGRPFDVVGRFHIRPEADEGELWQLYQIEDAIVIDQ